jgi:hypothetical protein
MIEWPGTCARCGREIEDWADAGLLGKRWLHKACWSEDFRAGSAAGKETPPLRSPLDRAGYLEAPMLIFLLMFHFGLGAAIAGWVMLTQGRGFVHVPSWAFFTSDPKAFATSLLVVGLIVPVVGLGGVSLNILSRRRIEIIRQALDVAGGWKPGRT